MAKSDGSGKDRSKAGPLEKLDGNPLGRLAEAVRDQETIVVSGGGWENVELLDILAKSIPTNHKAVELKPARDVGVREDALPPDHVVLVYNESLEEIAAASNMSGDYLIVPNMRFRDIKTFQRIAHNFKGGKMVGIVDAFPEHPEVRSIADVLIQSFNRNKAPLGIGEVWARPGRASEPIPPQGPGPHFTLSPDLRIALAPPEDIDGEGNNFARIRQLLPPIRQAAADLAGNLNPRAFSA